jgi:hypothetical protein
MLVVDRSFAPGIEDAGSSNVTFATTGFQLKYILRVHQSCWPRLFVPFLGMSSMSDPVTTPTSSPRSASATAPYPNAAPTAHPAPARTTPPLGWAAASSSAKENSVTLGVSAPTASGEPYEPVGVLLDEYRPLSAGSWVGLSVVTLYEPQAENEYGRLIPSPQPANGSTQHEVAGEETGRTPSSEQYYDDVHLHWGATGYYDENGNWKGGGYNTGRRNDEVRDAMVSYLKSLPTNTSVNLFPVPQSCEQDDFYYLETEETGKILSHDIRVEHNGDQIFIVVDKPGIFSKEKEIKRPFGERPVKVPSRLLVKPGRYDVGVLDKTGNLKKYILDNHKNSVKLYFRGEHALGYDGKTREYDTWRLIADIGSGKYRDKGGKPVDPKLIDHVALGMISGDPSSTDAGSMMYASLRLANKLDPSGKLLHISGAGETTWEKEGVRAMLRRGHVPQVGLNDANKSFFGVINKIGGVAVVHCDVGISPTAQRGIITAQTNYVHSDDIKKMFSSYTSPIPGRGGKIIWAHGGGLARTQLPGNQHIKLLREVLRDYPNVYIDLSWDVVAEQIAAGEGGTKVRMMAWAQLVHDYPDRFIYGSDSVGNPDARASESTLRVYERSGFLNALDEMDKTSHRNFSTAGQFLHGNYETVVLGAVKNVTAWRLANRKFLDDQQREYDAKSGFRERLAEHAIEGVVR